MHGSGAWGAMGAGMMLISLFIILGTISSIVTGIGVLVYLITPKANKNLKDRWAKVVIISCIIALISFGLIFATPWIVEFFYIS